MLILISGRKQSVGIQLFLPLFCGEAEFVVPFFSEASDEWFAQELVETDAAFCAETDGILADVPAMVVQSSQRSKLLLADRI